MAGLLLTNLIRILGNVTLTLDNGIELEGQFPTSPIRLRSAGETLVSGRSRISNEFQIPFNFNGKKIIDFSEKIGVCITDTGEFDYGNKIYEILIVFQKLKITHTYRGSAPEGELPTSPPASIGTFIGEQLNIQPGYGGAFLSVTGLIICAC